MAQHLVKWLSPAPLWRGALGAPEKLARPAILRFASDSFMEDFLALLERDPESVGELELRHETWRTPASNADASAASAKSQAAHVAAGSITGARSWMSPDTTPGGPTMMV